MQLLGSNITALRLLGVDSGMNEVSQNLSSYITGTLNRLTVTDNGAGGVTLDVSSSLGVAWSAITGKPPLDYSGGLLTISGDVYIPSGISTVEGTGSQAWDQCYYNFYDFYDFTLNAFQSYDQEFAKRPLERYVIPTAATTNIPVVAGSTYLVRCQGHSWDVGAGSDVHFTPPNFSTFRGGHVWAQYADSGLTLFLFYTDAYFNCSDGLEFDMQFLFTAGTSGNLACYFQGAYERLYIIITEMVH